MMKIRPFATPQPTMMDLKEELAKYIGVLAGSAARTNRAEDRAVYMQHMAAAALMFFLLQNNMEKKALDKWVSDERRTFGSVYLTGNEGKEAEAAFQRFAAAVEIEVTTH